VHPLALTLVAVFVHAAPACTCSCTARYMWPWAAFCGPLLYSAASVSHPPANVYMCLEMFVNASVSYGPGMAVKGYVPCRAIKVYACQGVQLLGCAHIMVPAPLQAHPKCTAAKVWALAP
jgi:hypothetical protein